MATTAKDATLETREVANGATTTLAEDVVAPYDGGDVWDRYERRPNGTWKFTGTLVDDCNRECERVVKQPDGRKWIFADGSSVVQCYGRWDLGIPGSSDDCHCWAGAQGGKHHESCPAADVTEVA